MRTRCRIVSEIDVKHVQKSFAGGAGRGQQKNGERNLSRDHRVVCAAAAHVAGDSACAALQELRHIRTRNLKSGPEAGKNRGGAGERDAEEQNRNVDADDGFLRDGIFGGRKLRSKAVPRHAMNKPIAEPATAITRDSVKSWRRMRERPAPTAARTANS